MAENITYGEHDNIPPELGGTGSGWPFGNVIGALVKNPYIPAIATVANTLLTAGSIGAKASAAVSAAKADQQAAAIAAAQRRDLANTVIGKSQREAYYAGRKADELISTIRARAGAGGTDPTVLNIIAGAYEEKGNQRKFLQYAGADQARSLRYQADLDEYSAAQRVKATKDAQKMSALSIGATLFRGVGDLADKYPKSIFDKYWSDKELRMLDSGQTTPDDVAF